MNKTIIFLVFLTLMAFLVAETNAQKPTNDDYIGTWTPVDAPNELLKIKADGHYYMNLGAFIPEMIGSWILDDDGRLIFYPNENEVSKKDIYVMSGDYLVNDGTKSGTFGLYDKYKAKYIDAKEEKKSKEKKKIDDTKKKIEDIFDIFKKK